MLATVLALGGCIAPPASSTSCRDDIAIAYARRSLDFLRELTPQFGVHPDTLPPDEPVDWSTVLSRNEGINRQLQDLTTKRCMEDEWPSKVAHCYRDAGSYEAIEACYRALPQGKCLAVEQATRITAGDPGGRCGEPAPRYF